MNRLSAAIVSHDDFKEEFYPCEDEIAGHNSYFELELETRCMIARIMYWHIEHDVDSDVDEYGRG